VQKEHHTHAFDFTALDFMQYLCQLGDRNWLKSGMNHAQAGNLFKDLS